MRRQIPNGWILWILTAVLSLAGTVSALAQDKPEVIHIGGVGNTFGKPFTAGVLEVLHSQKLLEKEFAKDGIRIDWNFFVGTGPAINEALASGKVDFGAYGDICGVIGKANGIQTTALADGGRGANIYIAVPAADQTTRTLEDLKGKRVGFLKGTYLHLEFERLLAKHHLNESDFQVFNLGQGEGAAALAASRIDAYVGTSYFYSLQQQGTLRVIYDSKKEEGIFQGGSVFVGRNEFIQKYPDVTRRVVKAYVEACHWASRPENREAFLRITTLIGVPYPAVKADYEGTSLRWRNSPLLDETFFRYYTNTVAFAKERELIRNGFDVTQWADPSYVDEAAKELGLEHFWDVKGKK
jgi:sulfonate transport system substrate-binding protein